ncbi:PHP domain protein [Clostridium tepidiprofundi DSM 19306]|uniref:PHP domain protein n=1 Tax=Clostridium tepidiprofundi DSM 19306 TaxID=1121338 RepID=A0A151AL52_9CLOT|nr:PHP domain-containing protein [Clostridium tepidiprofundi]KYH28386.1 PHP domain protein [Clostridium tepidiprofundi DSM 19306]
MKIDLHVHAKERSACSIASEKQHIESAIKFGLDAIIFTDHNRLVPLEHIKELNKRYYPFRIYGGIEIRISDCGEDVLVLGLHDKILEEKSWLYPDLYDYVRKNNGFIALAHPFRYKNSIGIDIEKYIPDAVEIHSTNIGRDDYKLIRKLAEKLNLNLITNSDGHNAEHVGIYYNDIEYMPNSEQELVKYLKEGRYKCCCNHFRVSKFNESVLKREKLIKELIKENKDRTYYNKLTGNWEGEFDRVLMGKSYVI